MTDDADGGYASETPLETWKEIGAYLERDARTAKRWESSEGLPVHRHLHKSRSSVYAYPSELDAWRAGREPAGESTCSLWLRPVTAFAWTVVIALALLTAGNGTQGGTVALAADGSGITVRQVWAGPGAVTTGGLSADGRHLSFVDWDTGDLAVRDLTTGENRHLTNKGSWENSDEFAELSIVSPDGKQVAYAWYNKDGVYELRVVGLDGSGQRVLLPGDKKDWLCPVDWSPDGRRILVGFVRNFFRAEGPNVSEFAFLSLEDGSIRLLVPILAKFTGAWPVPGTMTELWCVPVQGGEARRSGLALKRIGLGGVHPSGRQIVFDSGQHRESLQEVWMMENFLPESPTVN